MARIIKKAKERKEEILKTAQELFYQKGYEAASIEDIINTIGIAKGTFYHYFKSKEHLLGELMDYQTDSVIAMIRKNLDEFEGNAIEKFRLVVSSSAQWKFERMDLMLAYLQVLYDDKNVLLRFKLYKSYEKMASLFSEIIVQGKKEGLFDVDDATEFSEIFLSMISSFSERLSTRLLESKENPQTSEALIQKCLTFEKALEKLLGAKAGTLKIYNPELLKQSLDYFIENIAERADT